MVEIPIQPQRIIAEEYLGSLIALDIIPVGAPGLTIKNYYLRGVARCCKLLLCHEWYDIIHLFSFIPHIFQSALKKSGFSYKDV